MQILNSSQRDVATNALTIATGLMGWEYQTTYKFSQGGNRNGYGLFTKQRFGDAVAQTFGQSAAQRVLPGYSGAADFTVNPLGVINKVTVAGAAVLIGDSLLDGLPYYKDVSPFVEAIGWGLTIGGIVGGFFDDASNGTISGSPYSGTQTIQNPMMAQSLNRAHGISN
jgi:hypothetical protein